MEIITMKLEDLKPSKYNPRKDLQPGDPEYELIKKSILENGLVSPIVWNKRTGNIISGHQRYKVIKQLGSKETEVVVVDVDEKKEKSMNILLNKAVGDWDDERLALILQEAKKNDWLDKTGFEEEDINTLLDKINLNFEPATEDEQGNLDKLEKEFRCPSCGHKINVCPECSYES